MEWGVSIPDVGREVQQRVAAYLAQMASIELEAVDVIVDEIGVS
ncbi:MAG: Asp23/Gls24 family envelope stress response protein [Gaiellaceae bacterium]